MIDAIITIIKIFLVLTVFELVIWSFFSGLSAIGDGNVTSHLIATPTMLRSLPSNMTKTTLFKLPKIIGKIVAKLPKILLKFVLIIVDTVIMLVWNCIPIVRKFKAPKISKFIKI